MCISGIPVPVYQDPGELTRLRAAAREIEPKRVLEIGSLFGGTLWCWMQDAPGSLIVSIDTGVPPFDHRYTEAEAARLVLWPYWAEQLDCELVQVRASSQTAEAVARAAGLAPFDFIFIDGGHSYEEAGADFRNYWPLLREGGLLAMHDICYPDRNPEHYGSGRVWREIKAGGRYWSIAEYIREENAETWGIGAIWKGLA